MAISSPEDVKEKIADALRTLPPEGIAELSRYIEHLSGKYQRSTPDTPVVLGGLWADTDLDIDDADIRTLRQQTTAAVRKEK